MRLSKGFTEACILGAAQASTLGGLVGSLVLYFSKPQALAAYYLLVAHFIAGSIIWLSYYVNDKTSDNGLIYKSRKND